MIPVEQLGRVPCHLKPTNYGTHAGDFFVQPTGRLDVVAVDPGHDMLIDAVRYHTDGAPTTPTFRLTQVYEHSEEIVCRRNWRSGT